MQQPFRVGDDVWVLPSQMPVPGVGSIPINSFLLLAEQPMLVDTGLDVDRDAFMDALASIIDPADLRWVWLTHDDADHTGALEAVMAAAPQATLVTHAFGALRMNTWWPVPLDRVQALQIGNSIDLGDRTVHALRPPTYDNPMTTAIFDEKTRTFFCVDSFGAVLGGPVQSLDEVSADDLTVGMTTWTTFDSPWLHLTQPDKLTAMLDGVRALDADQVLSSHLPPATGRIDEFLDFVASLPDAEPFVAPDAASFAEIAAALMATRTA
jgi:flavorubredoxin